MEFRKITEGCVIQEFDDDGKCVSQRFVAGDNVEYEDGFGGTLPPEKVEVASKVYQPYHIKDNSSRYCFIWDKLNNTITNLSQ